MKKSPHNQIDWIDFQLFLLAFSVSIGIYYYRLEIVSLFLEFSEVTLLAFGVISGVFMAPHVLLFRLLTSEERQLDDAGLLLAPVRDRTKADVSKRLRLAVKAVDETSQRLVLFFVGFLVAAIVLFFFLSSDRLTIILILSTALLWNTVSTFRFYFRMKSVVRDLKRESTEILERHNARYQSLIDLEASVKSNPIENTDHMKGYSKIHH